MDHTGIFYSKELSDRVLREISNWLDREWRDLAFCLGFNSPESYVFQKSSRSLTLDMLIKWRERQPFGVDQSRNLAKALNMIGRLDLASHLKGWQEMDKWDIVIGPKTRALREEVLMETAKKLGAEWEELATSLGFSSEEIASMGEGEPSEVSFLMLQKWNSRQSKNVNQLGKLCDALANIGRADLISPLLHHTEFQQDSLIWISEKLEREWEKLALMLGFSAIEIFSISKDFICNPVRHCFVMLWEWKQRVDMTEDQLGHLSDALIDINRDDLLLGLQHYRVFGENKWHDIASFIGEDDWVQLAGALGLSSEEIDTIKADTPGDWKHQCCSMLEKWNHLQGTNEDQCIEKLCAALTDIGRKGLAILLQQHYQDRARTKGSSQKTGVTLNAGFNAIARRLDRVEWKKLALVLGLSKEDVFLINELYSQELLGSPIRPQVRNVGCDGWNTTCYSMLLIWKRRQSVGGEEIQEKLGDALNEIGKHHLAILIRLRPVLINDDVLLEVVRRLGPGWKELTTSLGISCEELTTMEEVQPSDQAFRMLQKWNCQQGQNKDHFAKLCDALSNIDRADLITPLLHYAELHQEVFDWISQECGPKWKRLALMLGFSALEINKIMKENPGNDTAHSLVMLKKLKQRVDMTKDQLGLLCNALTDVGQEELVGQLQHYRVVSEDKWTDIARFIGENDWVKLADVLGFSLEEIDTIQTDTPDNWKDQCCSMLEKWDHRQGMNEDRCIENLCAALTDIGRKGLAILLQQHYQDAGQTTKRNQKAGMTLDEELVVIAGEIGFGYWEKLAIYLGLSREDVGLIKGLRSGKHSLPYRLPWSCSLSEWQLLCPDEFQYEKPFHRQLCDPCCRMLLIWKHRQGVSEQDILGKLCDALSNLGKKDLVRQLRHRYGILETHRPQVPESVVPSDEEMLLSGCAKDMLSESNSPKPPSRLQMILDEYHSQIHDLSDEVRLDTSFQLPDIAIGYFNESGGSLSVDDYDVQLTIPPGAILPGFCQEVYVYVDTNEPPIDENDPTGITLSRTVHCGPPGVNFAKTVALSFPHQADLKSIDPEELTAQMCQDGDPGEMWEEFDGNVTVVNKDRVILLVNHFTWFRLRGKRNIKQLLLTAYGDVYVGKGIPYQLRVYVLDNNEAVKKSVEADEQTSIRLDGFKNLTWTGGDVIVKLSEISNGCQVHGEKIHAISKTLIKTHASNCVTFTLGNPSTLPADDELYCSVEAYQKCEDEKNKKIEKVCLSICPAAKTPSCWNLGTSHCMGYAGELDPSARPIGVKTSNTRESIRVRTEEKKMSFMKGIEDSTLRMVSRKLGPEWETLGTFLGFGQPDIFRFKNDNSATINQIFAMLVEWRDVQYPQAQVKRLQNSLRRISREDIADALPDINDASLRDVSLSLGPEWEELGRSLGFREADILEFKKDLHDRQDQILQMLITWRDKQLSPEAQLEWLCSYLTTLEKENLADELRGFTTDKGIKKTEPPSERRRPNVSDGDPAGNVPSQPTLLTNCY
ncbi:uncharacterized protein LOC110990671 isoform X2 [Acanthaster planci]|uniref:Uncharacterized protein LOC110990671 isoform X2 n=1 Tax=Acanthaster planci TaxID=133434 RepID=A0A8B8A120_ACAPL|nr:uncharacterized protein LOC110990671 isoform X2 [Acanthaster planci]